MSNWVTVNEHAPCALCNRATKGNAVLSLSVGQYLYPLCLDCFAVARVNEIQAERKDSDIRKAVLLDRLGGGDSRIARKRAASVDQPHQGVTVCAACGDECSAYLEEHGVRLLTELTWNRGLSFYFHDSEGNLLEIANADIWPE